MESYSAAKVFSPLTQAIWRVATFLIQTLPDPEEGALAWRCHELVRGVEGALKPVLDQGGSSSALYHQDGRYGFPGSTKCEHSWLIVLDQHAKNIVLLDVYAVGRLPQVQLVDADQQLAGMYLPHEYRTDIDNKIVQDLVRRWNDTLKDESNPIANDVRWLLGG